jgi:NhaP-type Na+/H+ or K+/H+ antiporter
MQVDVSTLLSAWRPVLWAIVAVLLARVVVVYGLSWITERLAEPISWRWRHILAWAGLRGALSLALVLSLPVTFGPDRILLRTMAFGVALFTLLVQAPTMNSLVRKLKIITFDPAQVDYKQRYARLTALRSAEAHIERLYREGLVSAPVWEKLKPKFQEQTALLADAVRELLRVEPALEYEELDTTRREILRAQRSAYLGMREDGVISEEVFENLSAEVDAALEEDGGPFWFVPQDSLPHRLKDSITGNAEVEEIQVESGATSDEMQVKDVPWPEHFVIVSLRRGTHLIIPMGDTILCAGDILTVVGEAVTLREARRLCQKDR